MRSFFLILSVVGLVACTKNKGMEAILPTPVAEEKEEISWANFSPQNDVYVPYGETVQLKTTVTAKEDLHGYNVKVYSLPDSVLLFNASRHIHDATFDIYEEWVNNVEDTTKVCAEITVTLDHEGHTASKKSVFHCLPQ